MAKTHFNLDTKCKICNGSCWKGKENNALTQKAAKEKFGVIPNNCVNGSDGSVHCPFAEE